MEARAELRAGWQVVALFAPRRDCELTSEFLGREAIATVAPPDFEALIHEIRQGGFAALVLAVEAIPRGGLPRLLAALEGQPAWSDLPIVMFVSARGSGPDEADLLLRGNVTLIDRPARRSTMLTAVRAALRARRRQLEFRDLLVRMQDVNRRKDEFLAMLGHELRNPLGVITNAVQVLTMSNDPGSAVQARTMIERQARHLGRLVDDLLDASRVMLGKISIKRELVDLRDVVMRCVQELAPAAERQGQTLRVSAPPHDALCVDGDQVRLEQVLSNLVHNALKYTPRNGHISVTLDATETELVLRVTDNGIGIDADLLPHVFELFTQADTSLVRGRGGLGLGLALVKHLVELHGGRIEARSDGVGRGTEVVVRLPRLKKVPVATSLPPAKPSGQTLRIVVVEDIQDAREILVEMLELDGHEAQGSGDGLDGAKLIVDLKPDLAIVDIGLPTLDGYEVARYVRERVGAEVRLVALTGYGQPQDRELALEAGFDAHLVKPIDPRHLAQVLSTIPRGAARRAG